MPRGAEPRRIASVAVALVERLGTAATRGGASVAYLQVGAISSVLRFLAVLRRPKTSSRSVSVNSGFKQMGSSPSRPPDTSGTLSCGLKPRRRQARDASAESRLRRARATGTARVAWPVPAPQLPATPRNPRLRAQHVGALPSRSRSLICSPARSRCTQVPSVRYLVSRLVQGNIGHALFLHYSVHHCALMLYWRCLGIALVLVWGCIGIVLALYMGCDCIVMAFCPYSCNRLVSAD